MNLNVYPTNEHHDIETSELSTAKADAAFKMWCEVLRTPWGKNRRVTLTDPLAGNRLVRDSDREVFGFGKVAA